MVAPGYPFHFQFKSRTDSTDHTTVVARARSFTVLLARAEYNPHQANPSTTRQYKQAWSDRLPAWPCRQHSWPWWCSKAWCRPRLVRCLQRRGPGWWPRRTRNAFPPYTRRTSLRYAAVSGRGKGGGGGDDGTGSSGKCGGGIPPRHAPLAWNPLSSNTQTEGKLE